MNRIYETLPKLQTDKVWAEVSFDALRRNYRVMHGIMQKKRPHARLIAVVKADAYCHSVEIAVPAFLREGCDFFAVSSTSEAIAVRRVAEREGKHPDILIMGYSLPSEAAILAEHDLIQALISLDYAVRLSECAAFAGVTVRTHVKVDTGMNRVGFAAHSDEEIASAVQEIRIAVNLPGIAAEGIFSHFARADEEFASAEEDLSRVQYERMMAVDRGLRAIGVEIPMRHLCNGVATVRFPSEYLLEGVRIGLPLYGIPPTDSVTGLLPAMRLKSVVAHLHRLLPGEGVGYGSTYRSDSERTLATLPIGYADGLLRGYRDAEVTVMTDMGAYRVPLVGRICMDQCMADVTGCPVREGDEVVFFGNDPMELTALARRAGTIEHEALCLIGGRVPRLLRP